MINNSFSNLRRLPWVKSCFYRTTFVFGLKRFVSPMSVCLHPFANSMTRNPKNVCHFNLLSPQKTALIACTEFSPAQQKEANERP
jgi:hypothetical protein